MFEVMLWCVSKIYEDAKDSFNRNNQVYEEIGRESAEYVINLLGLDDSVMEDTIHVLMPNLS